MKPKLQSILFILFCFLGTAVSAAPSKIEDRHEYSTALNSVASVIMNWYGSLIVRDTALDENIGTVNFNTKNIGDQWSQYRSQYPKNITQILITKTDLTTLNADYVFKVNSTFIYKNAKNTIQSQKFKESFLFSNALLSKSLDSLAPIKKVSLIAKQDTTVLEDSDGYDREHYKVREFVYAWLTYLDGVHSLSSVMNGDQWLAKANYSLEMGAVKTQGSIENALAAKMKLLAKGGHLLRSLEVIKATDADKDSFIIELILEWKGVNQRGKPVIAKIRQQLHIKIKDDKSWQLMSIKEKHLLPVIGPWMGLLC